MNADYFEQSTPIAADRRVYFTAVDATALQTRLAAASIGTWVVYLSKNGATPAVSSVPSTVEVGSANMLGVWYVQLSAADVDTVGRLQVTIRNTSATDIEPREFDIPVRQAFLATVVSATTTTITCDRAESTADYFKDALVLYRTGSLKGQVKKIGAYSTGLITLATDLAFTGSGSNGDIIEILTR